MYVRLAGGHTWTLTVPTSWSGWSMYTLWSGQDQCCPDMEISFSSERETLWTLDLES